MLFFYAILNAIVAGRLHIHGMWFDIYKGEDYLFSKDQKRFVVIDVSFTHSLEFSLSSIDQMCD